MRVYALPVLQSAFSTALVVAPLLVPSSYILRNFAKIVILIVFLGAVHGLIVLPALFAAYYSRRNIFGLIVALVKTVAKGTLMFIRCKVVRSVNVMDSAILGTFRLYIFMHLVNYFISILFCINPPYLVYWRMRTQKRLQRQPRSTAKKEFHHQTCMMVRDTQIYLNLSITVHYSFIVL